MATDAETVEIPELGTGRMHWGAGGLAGVLAGVLFGGGVMDPAAMMPTVAALYGADNAIVGWGAHLIHSLVFGLIFVAIVALPAISRYADRPVRGAITGGVYGIAVWAVAAVVVMPLWIGMVTAASPPVPNFNWLSLVGHVAYGVVLGAFYPVFLAFRD